MHTIITDLPNPSLSRLSAFWPLSPHSLPMLSPQFAPFLWLLLLLYALYSSPCQSLSLVVAPSLWFVSFPSPSSLSLCLPVRSFSQATPFIVHCSSPCRSPTRRSLSLTRYLSLPLFSLHLSLTLSLCLSLMLSSHPPPPPPALSISSPPSLYMPLDCSLSLNWLALLGLEIKDTWLSTAWYLMLFAYANVIGRCGVHVREKACVIHMIVIRIHGNSCIPDVCAESAGPNP